MKTQILQFWSGVCNSPYVSNRCAWAQQTSPKDLQLVIVVPIRKNKGECTNVEVYQY